MILVAVFKKYCEKSSGSCEESLFVRGERPVWEPLLGGRCLCPVQLKAWRAVNLSVVEWSSGFVAALAQVGKQLFFAATVKAVKEEHH